MPGSELVKRGNERWILPSLIGNSSRGAAPFDYNDKAARPMSHCLIKRHESVLIDSIVLRPGFITARASFKISQRELFGGS